jgi:quinolinate synthase
MPEQEQILPAVFADAPPRDLEIATRIADARAKLGKSVLILGHHYQRDEVIEFADFRGDSYDLARRAAGVRDAEVIIFCGVHFMAETADILSADHQKVLLPDLNAGCSMADMADVHQVEECWDAMSEVIDTSRVIPITYMNSTAAIKAFCGVRGGTVCTSSNADKILKWAFERGDRVIFIPDQHLGRNTGLKMGIDENRMHVWDPDKLDGGIKDADLEASKIILWKGHCSVHQNFLPSHVDFFRNKFEGINILVHPECQRGVVDKADFVGSTAYIIRTIEQAEEGTRWAIGTEHHLVNRLAKENPHLHVSTLAPFACQCATMFRIDPKDLAELLEDLVDGKVRNQITVPAETKKDAHLALQRMLEITEGTAAD